MKLSLDLLVQSLKSEYSFTECQKNSDAFIFNRPIFYQEGSLPENYTIYILYDAVPPDKSFCPSDSVFLCQKSRQKACNIPEENLCVFSDEDSLLQVFNHIQKLFDKYEQWDEQLHALQSEGGSIHQILEASYPVFQNPILVQNLDFTTIASCQIPEKGKDSPSLELYQNMEFINTLKQDAFFNKVREWNGVFLFPDHVTGFPFPEPEHKKVRSHSVPHCHTGAGHSFLQLSQGISYTSGEICFLRAPAQYHAASLPGQDPPQCPDQSFVQ